MEYKSYMNVSKTAQAARQTKDFPIATYSLVFLNLVLFFGSLPGDRIDLAIRYGLVPDRLEVLRLFTSIFLHFDFVHLAVNVIFLWLFGRKVERVIGPLEFLLFYIGSGFTASLLHMSIANAFLPPVLLRVPVVGASGAVAGVLGMYAVRFSDEKLSVGWIVIPSLYLLLSWLVIQAAFGMAGILLPTGRLGPIDLHYIGYWSHIGGFVFGMTAAWLTTSKGTLSASGLQVEYLRRQTLLDVAERLRALGTAAPSDPLAHSELGRTLALLQDQPASIEAYLTAIELYRKAGMRDEALKSLRDALSFWPNASLPHDILFRFACYLEMLSEPEEASDCFAWLADAAEGEPEGEMALLKLAQIELDRLKHPEQAIKSIERLVSKYPNSRWMGLVEQIKSRASSEEQSGQSDDGEPIIGN